ncbi:NDUFA12-domain-containing protein [Butyriboletus roseoflavus]|nr:NDUFA12-domain-containing protein [Butyriboletus roseoflavus]
MVSLARYIRNIRRTGIKQWWHQMQYIGDAKAGTIVGTDQYAVCCSVHRTTNQTHSARFGNRYFENLNPDDEVPGRHRWVDFAQHYNNATQVPPEWHSWLQHIRQLPPTEDEIVKNASPPWKAPWVENLTGTRGAYRPYNTVVPKINAWQPKVAARG